MGRRLRYVQSISPQVVTFRARATLALAAAFLTALTVTSAYSSEPELRISVSDLRDHILGGWVGQGVGVCFGASYEFKSCGAIIEGELEPWTPEKLAGSLDQDDLYVETTFLAALEAYGPGVTYEQAGHAFAATTFRLWHANHAGRENVRRGIMPPISGHPRYNIHADDIDFQIQSDVLGLVCPGLPQSSNDLCDVFGHITNYGDAVYSGMWIASMYSQAFFEKNVERLVVRALDSVPAQSKFARCIRDVLKWRAEHPNDWRAVWQKVEDAYNDNIDCVPRAAFNIDAILNSAYVAIGLLYGGGDMAKTMEIAVRCGQDADCNASTACGVLGCILGLSGIPEVYKSHLPVVRDSRFSNSIYTYDSAADACVAVARRIVEDAGGKSVTEDGVEFLVIPRQLALPPITLEQWPDEQQKRVLGLPVTSP